MFHDKWQINISELHRILIRLASNSKKKLPRLLKKYEDISLSDYDKAVFVKEMNKINLKTSDVEDAISDYCQTQDTIIDLLDENSLFIKDIKNFKEGELLKYLKTNKRLQNLESGDKITNSERNFLNCLYKLNLIDLELIENEPFFQRGNIHSLVDEGLYNWLLDED